MRTPWHHLDPRLRLSAGDGPEGQNLIWAAAAAGRGRGGPAYPGAVPLQARAVAAACGRGPRGENKISV